MTPHARRSLIAAAFAFSCLACVAQPAAPSVADQLHGRAVAAFQRGRFAEAYGRFMALADAGHVRSADVVLFMYTNQALFNSDWDVTQDQLNDWAKLTGRAAPVQVGRIYPRQTIGAARRS